MTKVIAKFSNGFTDEYKGTRDVKAAWMITRKSDGKILNSGHSLDAARARKTAESNTRYASEPQTLFNLPRSPRGFIGIESKKYNVKKAREMGLLDDIEKGSLSGHQLWMTVYARAKAYNEKVLAEARALLEIEVINL